MLAEISDGWGSVVYLNGGILMSFWDLVQITAVLSSRGFYFCVYMLLTQRCGLGLSFDAE